MKLFIVKKILNFLIPQIKKILGKNLNVVLDLGVYHSETLLNLVNCFHVKKIYALDAFNINFFKIKKAVKHHDNRN